MRSECGLPGYFSPFFFVNKKFCRELKAIDDGTATVDITDTAEKAEDADAAESSKNKSETGAF